MIGEACHPFAIGFHAGQRAGRDTGIHRSLGHGGCNAFDETRIEWTRNEIVAAEAKPELVARDSRLGHDELGGADPEAVADRDLLLERQSLDREVLAEGAERQLSAELLERVDGVEPLAADDHDHRRSWFVYPVWLPPGLDREALIARLDQDGIDTSRYLPSIHLQPYMRERFGFSEGLCPVSEEASHRLLSLPFWSGISPEDQERVVEALRTAITR